MAANGQGRFEINFKGDGNDIRFVDLNGAPVVGTEGYRVEIFAGTTGADLRPLGSLALNRTTPAADLGYPNPSAQTFEMGAGETIWIGYGAFVGGSDFSTSDLTWPIIRRQMGDAEPAALTVVLAQAPNPPSIVTLGTGVYVVPEPVPWWLLGIGGLGLLLGRVLDQAFR
jgi:hypothetical protein